ncbi:diguanylate cyclase (GGDEF) domain-containing protein [Peptoclostridium litorale DSM 5388]|uniref:Diguanylate cyclase n=1 Tax=Peptoclostridium litorale DSM 5388 TaxID=1121324 RepID=A0A069RQ78_PEPLI|nr:histidine kinase N-terminal 7TM domain-containing protein [Peptoclostridium litorale]KDR96332.1 diguanylate cyclase [Peptoclostridium litorale DSM 5388]SIO26519.1 diguanylate cyclase (GGDEF) domain-containing protein [Peptoclostridium litorale DSM 5388]
MKNALLSCILTISSILIANMAIYAMRRRKVPGAFAFSLLLFAISFHSLGYAFELLSDTVDKMYFGVRFEYIGISFYPVIIAVFARQYADERRILTKSITSLLITISIATLIFVNTNTYHLLYYKSLGIDSTFGFNVLKLEKGIWYYVQSAALIFSNIYGVAAFAAKSKKSRGDYRKRALFMLTGCSIPVVVFVIYILGMGPAYIDIMTFAYMPMSLLIGVGMFRYEILFLTPVTHEMVFNSIDEAVIVADKNGRLISCNDSAKSIFPSMKRIGIGESLYLIEELCEYDFESDLDGYEIEGKIYSLKVIEMKGGRGRIYVANDITESEMAKKQLKKMAITDALTGIYNRRHFMEKLENEKTEGAFAIIDIDHFKNINDTFGHVEGDKVLVGFANKLKNSFSNDLVCRYGGEEFALFMDIYDLEMAFKRIEEFRKNIAEDKSGINFTFSAGVAKYRRKNLSECIVEADRRLYEAKGNGRNRVVY